MIKIALAGNPNVGKSTIFNNLTGKCQHTGNWAGKTVENTSSIFKYKDIEYELFDLPGTYSLISHSLEEELARDFICYHEKDLVVVVCDSLCLERNLNLVLQILEITNRVIVVVNLMDEAKKKNVKIDLKLLSKKLGVPVIGTSARKKNSMDELLDTIQKMDKINFIGTKVRYSKKIELMINDIEKVLIDYDIKNLNKRFISLKILENDKEIIDKINKYLNLDLLNISEIKKIINNFSNTYMKDYIVKKISDRASEIALETVKYDISISTNNIKLDKILTSKATGIPIMLILVSLVFWLTIVGANYPSNLLHDLLFGFEKYLYSFFDLLNTPDFITNLFVSGIYETLAWVISVMFPPMVIFFPLFMLLEDFGYLPRIAFNLDKCFQKCKTCGKQALTMCMGFGCNAVGVTGCRIIDSPRERLIAIITNSFVPCNGRFPILIAIVSIFFTTKRIANVFILLLIILFSILITFLVSFILSKTLFKGEMSSFTLELSNYRKPQFFKTIKNSILDKALKILLRAIIISIPAGIIIFLLSNIYIDNNTLLFYISNFLDPFGKSIGLDGVIITAFILAFPANELVIPIMIMAYLSLGNMMDYSNLLELKNLLINNNWTILTAINMIILTLFHYPCSTTCLTIKKETGKWYYVFLSFIIPLIVGLILCLITKLLFTLF